MSNILDAARDLQDSRPRTVTDALKLIAKAGYACCVAGGYVRDMAYGQQPKDIDIIVMDYEEQGVDSIMHLLMQFPAFADKTAEDVEYQQEAKSSRIHAVFSFFDEERGLPVDVILYNAETLADALSKFDFNINACWFSESYMSPSCLGHAPALTGLVWWDRAYGLNSPTKPGAVIKWRDDLCLVREERMLKKFKSLGYEVQQRLDELDKLTNVFGNDAPFPF